MSDVIFIKERLDKGKTFNDIYHKASDIEAKRADYVVQDTPHNLWMADDGTISFNVPTPAGNNVINQKPTSWALSQLSTKLGMPSGYAEKCILSRHPDLAANNINTWLADQGENKRKKPSYLVRSYDGSIDGILSANYSRFDTTKILDAIKDTMDVDDYHIVGSYVSDERMHVRMIQDSMLNVDGEDLYPGIFIDSSDVGRTALYVRFGIWKKVCTNGMCISKVGGMLYHQRHMGIDANEVISELKQNLRLVPSLITKSETIITAAKADKIDLKDEKTFERMVNEIRRSALISEEEAKKVLETATIQYDMSRWGIVNAMTLIAQNYELDKRIQIEDAAGKLVVV